MKTERRLPVVDEVIFSNGLKIRWRLKRTELHNGWLIAIYEPGISYPAGMNETLEVRIPWKVKEVPTF